MSGYASYEDAHNPKYGEPYDVPLYLATEECLQDYGMVVRDFDKEDVWIETWPQPGTRPICPGTGNQGGEASGKFTYWWDGQLLRGRNEAVQRGDEAYVIGRLPKDESVTDRSHVLCREANYHPDGGQVFFVEDNKPFVALLAKPGDGIRLQDFVAFYFDGSVGLQIYPNIWHQPMYPIEDTATFLGKQGKVHACVAMDSVVEFGRFMRIPLKLENAVPWSL